MSSPSRSTSKPPFPRPPPIPDQCVTDADTRPPPSYDAAEDNEVSFCEGERITGIEEVGEGWWQGVTPRGEMGMFPGACVVCLQRVCVDGLMMCRALGSELCGACGGVGEMTLGGCGRAVLGTGEQILVLHLHKYIA